MTAEMVLGKIREYLDKHRNKYLKILMDLIKIPSISAEKDPEPRYQAIEFVKNKFDYFNATHQIIDEYNSDYPLILAELSPSDNKSKSSQQLLWMGHLDVQPPGQIEKWTRIQNPFRPKRFADRLYGRGSMDTKSQIAAQLSAVDILKQLSLKNRHLHFLFTTDEEIGSAKSTLGFFQNYRKYGIDPKRYTGAINGENTKERMVLGCKGILHCKLTASDPLGRDHSGRSMFHSFHPILTLSHFFSKIRFESQILLDELNSLNPSVKLIENDDVLTEVEYFENVNELHLPLKGLKIALGENLWNKLTSAGWSPQQIGIKFASISFNPSKISSGGTKTQTIVPDDAIAEIDMRLPPKVSLIKVREILKRLVEKYPPISMEILSPPSSDVDIYYQGAFTSPFHPFVKEFSKICNHVYQRPRILMPFSTGTSDDRFLEVLGLPHIKFGARGRNNHSYNEWVHVPSFFRIIQVYALMMTDLKLI